MDDKGDHRAVQSSCVHCREKKRKCNGKTPCANCIKFKQNCSYQTTSDRRRRKYHTDYVDFLEVKVNIIEQFIKEFVKNDPELEKLMSERLKNLSKYESDEDMMIPKKSRDDEFNTGDEELIDDLLSATEQLRIDGDDLEPNIRKPSLQYTSEVQDLLNETPDVITSTTTPISIIGSTLAFRDQQFASHLIDLFEENFAIYSMALKYMISTLRSQNYNYSANPTLHLFQTVVFGIASIFSTHNNQNHHEKLFIAMARDNLMSITCKCKVDIYLVLSLYLLSCYELGQGNLHQSYVMNSMACSITQHLGLHISYDDDEENLNYAPKSSPLNQSILWAVCLQDRMITSLVQVPCVIHFKRIISPFYRIETTQGMDFHVAELCFGYLSRLWYIYDRYTDQIFSINFDIGDTNNREKVLVMALKTLKELMNSLPIQLRFSSLNLKKTFDQNNENLFILLFNINYQVAVLQLNRIFIKDIPHLTRKATVIAAIKAANSISLLIKNDELFATDKLPYYLENSTHAVALVLLFTLTAGHSKHLYQLKSDTNILGLYQDCIELLTRLSSNWPSATYRLNHLSKLSAKYDLEKNFFTPSGSESVTSPLAKSVQNVLEEINDEMDVPFLEQTYPNQASISNPFPATQEPTLQQVNSFQLFDAQFPMYGLNPFAQQQPQPPLQDQQQQQQQQQQDQQFFSSMFQQFVPPSPQPPTYPQPTSYPPPQQPQQQQQQHNQQHLYSPPPQNFQSQNQERSYTNSSNDIAPLSEEFF